MARFRCACALAAALLAGCTKVPTSNLAPGERPALDSLEAGLWMRMDRAEEELIGSGKLINDPELDTLLNSIICELDHTFCHDVRAYVIRAPNFNASMAPNGMMQIWSGLLLRVQNEAELAYVLGHELAHYRHRHSLKRWVDLRNRADAASVFAMVTLAFGVGAIGIVAQTAAMTGSLAFSREQETDADQLGAELVASAGYDIQAAVDVWNRVRAEQDVRGDDEPLVFFSTHPGIEQRIDSLEQWAQESAANTRQVSLAKDRFLPILNRHFGSWFDDEIARNPIEVSLHLLQELEQSGRNPGEIAFYRGEVYRKRGEEADLKQAITQYEQAIARGTAPAAVHRHLGQVLLRLGHPARAKQELAVYLMRAPDAHDAQMIQSQLDELR